MCQNIEYAIYWCGIQQGIVVEASTEGKRGLKTLCQNIEYAIYYCGIQHGILVEASTEGKGS